MRNSILTIVTTNRPAGGTRSVLENIERYFAHTEITFEYLFSEDGSDKFFDKFVVERGSTIHVLPAFSLRSLLSYIRALYSYYKYEHQNICAVHVHAPNIAFLHFLFAACFGIRVRVLHCHSTRFSDKRWKAIRNAVLIWPARLLLTHRCACGREAARFMFGKRHIKDTYIFHNAIEVDRFGFSPLARERTRRCLELGSALVLGHIGNFYKVKNHDFLIDVFAKVHKACPESVLLLVGLGPLEQEVRDKVYHLGLGDCVRFLGYRSDIPQLLMAMDAFLFPSLFEGFPVSLVEAQCTGLPCFVADTVTKEAKITDNVQFLPITGQNAAKQWLDDILQTVSSFERRDQSEVLLKAGYDLAHEVKNLEQYYRRIVSEAYEAKGL